MKDSYLFLKITHFDTELYISIELFEFEFLRNLVKPNWMLKLENHAASLLN